MPSQIRGGPCSIRRRTGSARPRSSPQGIRSTHHVTPRSASGPARSRPAGPAGLAPPRTMSNGLSARPFSPRQPRRNSTRSRTSLTSGGRPVAKIRHRRDGPVPPCRPPHRRLVRPDTSDPDRHPRALHRSRQEKHIIDRDLVALIGHRLTGPQQIQRVQALIQPLSEHPGIGRVAETPVLAGHGRAQPGTEDHAPAGQAVHVVAGGVLLALHAPRGLPASQAGKRGGAWPYRSQ
jgi:hypothetical protein